jgi:hypothetical protein
LFNGKGRNLIEPRRTKMWFQMQADMLLVVYSAERSVAAIVKAWRDV